GDRVPTKTKSCVVRLPRLCAYLFRCRSAFHSFVLYVHTGVRGRNCVDVFFVIAGNFALRFPCPRCGKPFFEKWWYYNSAARRCVHCGLPKYADPSTPNSQRV